MDGTRGVAYTHGRRCWSAAADGRGSKVQLELHSRCHDHLSGNYSGYIPCISTAGSQLPFGRELRFPYGALCGLEILSKMRDDRSNDGEGHGVGDGEHIKERVVPEI